MSSFEGQFPAWIGFRSARVAEADFTASEAAESGLVSASPARARESWNAASTHTDDHAIAALVGQYASSLYRVAFSVVRNSAEAEDAVQETFLRVLKNREKLPSIRNARVWLVRITWNIVLDRKRRSKVRPETDDVADLTRTLPCSGPGTEAVVIATQGYRRILRLIDALPGKEREVMLLSAIEELETAEIASVLRTTESAVRSRLFRARQALAHMLADSKTAPMQACSRGLGGKL